MAAGSAAVIGYISIVHCFLGLTAFIVLGLLAGVDGAFCARHLGV